LEPPGAPYAPPHQGLAATIAAGAGGGVTVTVLPGGATTVVPPGDGVITVVGDALGGTTTVGGGDCARAGVMKAVMRPSPRTAAVMRERVMTFLL